MKKQSTLSFVATALLVAANTLTVIAAPVIRTASGANPAAIQATVDRFRADLGGANNGVGGSFTTGRREINWDGVPDSFASPNLFPVDFFNSNSPRGVVFDTISAIDALRVSADSNNPTSTAVRFGEINVSYQVIFQTFSAERLFARVDDTSGVASGDHHEISIVFFIPGTRIPATVSGFGVVFTDVDDANKSGVICFGTDGKPLNYALAPAADGGLSFAGISFNAGERIARVVINSGSRALSAGNTDMPSRDMVAMDDFIYGEPRSSEYHTADFDGDGTSDFSVYRPSTGQWFFLNSGSNTFTAAFFGTNGDIPIDGDFDGDSRTDLAVFRPSSGTWYRQNSSNGAFSGTQWGISGDKPVPGDYDKDGKTDIAVWRPSNGNYYILRSSDGTFSAFHWGASGDIPIGTAAAQ